ncbi:M20/M25/M40 family metallo-hydrolase [Flavobacterium crassostreae]|uniref:Peptidase M28 n=1 Tax=Flavobacterium crassostreae TaxID=1763534 RepID=A0A1B9E0C7_9FLAO|nr:M20/M25/M40 family metallo-hydrolase [Flavobacterium crassostreae]OCB75390.1 peptidase M28 [Flavobacterium crassostreae]
MKKSFISLWSTLFILIVLAVAQYTMMPRWTSNDLSTLSEFSTDRAFAKATEIAKKPHYVSSKNHQEVALYLQEELTNLGLETSIQEGYTLTNWGNLVKAKNIIAKIKGTSNNKALVLLSHYDSAPHSSSKGASDAGSGVATILEAIRAYKYQKKTPKNDILILFTDAEEIGLNGAALFVTKHHWAKEVGLVLNFEARGTSGPSYMLVETNNGNTGLIKEFAKAKTTFPVTNSLMYSIYKMLPNDTDLTVFREKANIQGFNFAFIDGHYNYHTAQDTITNLDKASLAHQGAYLMPLLDHFSKANLNATHSNQDSVYFSIPYTIINYPFGWVMPMLLLSVFLFVVFVLVGIAKKILLLSDIIKGFIPLLAAIFTTLLAVVLGWKIVSKLYPQYKDMLNGFTYNGQDYIVAFVMLSVAICFGCYQLFSKPKLSCNHYVAPLFLWLLINAGLAGFLQGAGFLILPVMSGLLAFGIFIITQKNSPFLNLILSIPALILIVPFIQTLPVGLGLNLLFGSGLLTVLTFVLLLPIFGKFEHKGIWALVFLFLSIGFFAKAHYGSGYEAGKAKSNSLVYILNTDTETALWATYDKNLDYWTQTYLGKKPQKATSSNKNPLFSKYNSVFTYVNSAPIATILKPTVAFVKDTIIANQRHIKIKITPNRDVNRYDIFANPKMIFTHFKANGTAPLDQKGSTLKRNGKRVLSYYVLDNEPLEMVFTIPKTTVFDMELVESSFDLMQNPSFNMRKRATWMMPTPFVLTDAVIITQHLKPNARTNQLPQNKDTTDLVLPTSVAR